MYSIHKKLKVDELIELDMESAFNDSGDFEGAFFHVTGDMITDDFPICYNILNTSGYRLHTKKEFIHSLMHYVSNIHKMIKLSLSFQDNGENDNDDMYR